MILSAPLLAALLSAPAPTDPLWTRALALHRRAIVVDTHSDTTSRMLDDGLDIGLRDAKGHMDLPRMKEGGIDAEFFAIYVSATYAKEGGSARRALDMIDVVRRAVERYPDQLVLATTAADVRRAAAAGRIAALMGIEGGHAIEDSLGALRMFHALGVRYMTLTHSNTNNWADSSGDSAEKRWGGLNDLGRSVVREMNRIGMIVDISHVSDEAFFDVLETSTAPVFASHSSVRAISSHARNMTDDMIRALAKNGGVIQINFACDFLDEEYMKEAKAVRDAFRAEAEVRFKGDPEGLRKEMRKIWDVVPRIPPPPLARLMDHFEHVVKLVGPDHVGLGSDFDGVSCVPAGMEDATKLPHITYELLKRGYKDADVLKILGGNTLRVMEAVEKESKRLKAAPRPVS